MNYLNDVDIVEYVLDQMKMMVFQFFDPLNPELSLDYVAKMVSSHLVAILVMADMSVLSVMNS